MTEHNFPLLKNDRLLKAARGEAVDRVPVWIMRQAGRYLPEFQEVRAKHDFFTICQTPTLALIPQAMGLEVQMVPGVGPVLPQPINDPSDISRLVKPVVSKDLKYIADAITLTRHSLEGKVPLIGFTGAPWTLMGYMIQGGGSSTLAKARSWLYKYSAESHILLQLITNVIVDYVVMQIKAGAQLVQIFESNGDYLNDKLFMEYSLRYLRQISQRVRMQLKQENIPEVPMTVFPKGITINSLETLAKEQLFDVIGIDWTIDPSDARKRVGPNVTLQGNLDPCALYAAKDQVYAKACHMVQEFGKNRYIANLGHGILPDITIESVKAFIHGIHSV
ncbi:hypothetical protein KM043_014483 [Ampulex compressa]|nr:hypothetical protein KM043_014483 [Ampulex compressa]